MRGKTYWYILYVRSGKEQQVISDFKQVFLRRGLPYALEPFCPESEYYYRNRAERRLGRSYRRRPLFSGYVFLETDMPQKEFLEEFTEYIYESEAIIRILKYPESNVIALSEREQMQFEFLFCGKRCLEHSEGYIEGDRIFVTAGPLVGREGLIRHVNRHNRVATVRLEILGGVSEVKVALEIIEKR